MGSHGSYTVFRCRDTVQAMFEVPKIDWKAFGKKLFRPDQPDYERVRSLVEQRAKLYLKDSRGRTGAMSAAKRAEVLTSGVVLREIWEGVTSELDAAWAYEDPGRTFLPFLDVPGPSDSLGVKATTRFRLKPLARQSQTPLDLEIMVSLLSMPQHVVRAIEQDAMEAAHRLRPFELGHAVDRVSWVLVPPVWSPYGGSNAWFTAGLAGSWNEVFRADQAAWDDAERCQDLAATTATESGLSRSSARHAAGGVSRWYAWEWCAGQNLVIEPHDYSFGYSSAVFGRRFAEIPNPLDPLLRIEGRGVDLIDLRGNTVILGIPWMHGNGIMSTLSALRRNMEKKYKIGGYSTATAVSRKR